jgi:rhomboid family GlyGly-CTERM serine protease
MEVVLFMLIAPTLIDRITAVAVGLWVLALLTLLQWAAEEQILLPDLSQTAPLATWWAAHFVHFGWQHFLSNAANFAVLYCLVMRHLPLGLWALMLMLLPPWISFCVLSAEGAVVYRGFSGLLCGLAFVGALCQLWRNTLIALAVLLGLSGKIVWELLPGFNPGYAKAWLGGDIAVSAHWSGALGGVVILLLYSLWASYRRLPLPWSKPGP